MKVLLRDFFVGRHLSLAAPQANALMIAQTNYKPVTTECFPYLRAAFPWFLPRSPGLTGSRNRLNALNVSAIAGCWEG